MAKLTSAPTPERFSKAWAEDFEAAVKRAAGTDARLTRAEAKKMAQKTDGDQFFADDALKYLDQYSQNSVSVSKIVAWAPSYALAAGARVAGADNRISLHDATSLPPSLIEDFFLLRGRAPTTGPASELAVVKTALEDSTEGLTLPSETDANFKFVSSRRLDPDEPINEATIRALLSAQHDELIDDVMWVDPSTAPLSTRTPVEERSAEDFLRALSDPADPNDPASVEQARKFSALSRTLSAQLHDLKVFRFGTVNISTFIVGRTRSGELAGLLTGQVET